MKPGELFSINHGERRSDERLVVFHRLERRNFNQRGYRCQKLAGGTMVAVTGPTGRPLLFWLCGSIRSMRMAMTMSMVMTMAVTACLGIGLRRAGLRRGLLVAATARAMRTVVVKQPHGEAGDGIHRQHRDSQQRSRELFHEHLRLLQLSCDKHSVRRLSLQSGYRTRRRVRALARFVRLAPIG